MMQQNKVVRLNWGVYWCKEEAVLSGQQVDWENRTFWREMRVLSEKKILFFPPTDHSSFWRTFLSSLMIPTFLLLSFPGNSSLWKPFFSPPVLNTCLFPRVPHCWHCFSAINDLRAAHVAWFCRATVPLILFWHTQRKQISAYKRLLSIFGNGLSWLKLRSSEACWQ